jgi:PAS domain S-box-containing protein
MIDTSHAPFMKSGSDYNEEMEASFATAIKSPDAFVAIDYEFNFLFVNRVAEKFYNKPKKELLGHRVPDIFPQQWNFGPFKSIQKNVTGRTHFEINYNSPFLNKWVKLTGRPFENYYTFSYKIVDQKTSLNNELRDEVRKGKK